MHPNNYFSCTKPYHAIGLLLLRVFIQPCFFCCPGESISWRSRKKSGFRNTVFCPNYISLLNIVASPSCTEYQWATLIVL